MLRAGLFVAVERRPGTRLDGPRLREKVTLQYVVALEPA